MVWRFPSSAVQDLSELYDAGDAIAAEAFDRILDEAKPDIVHFHARTRAASLLCLRKAKQRGLKVVYTYHTPTATCLRGTMMRNGAQPCEGEMRTHRCASCQLATKLPAAVAVLLGAMPTALGSCITRQGGVWTALRMSSLAAAAHRGMREFLAEADQVVAVCEWVRAVLLRNGVPESKVELSRQGLTGAPPDRLREERQLGPLRVAFLGRLDPTKGVDVLVRAMQLLPQLQMTLDVYGIAQGEAGERYRSELLRLAQGDDRIQFLAPVRAEEVVSTLVAYDLLAVPSQWLETGPLVVLEAFAAGLPVMGSRLGGIAELVTDGVNGRLVEAADVKAWAQALAQAAGDPSLIREWSRGVSRPRVMSTVAAEMLDLYQANLAS
jgi:glycosyltransferase involved in cell wall biosynthesis